MQIKKFKLINDGYDGITITAAEAISVNKAAAVDDVTRTRKLPIPIALKGKIAGLTYFFLNLTRHWVAPFNSYFNLVSYDLKPIDVPEGEEMKKAEQILRALWNDTTITGASINGGEIIITGKINAFGDKVMGLSTPAISEEDDFGFYDELKTRLDEIADDIINLLSQATIKLDASQMMLSFPKIEGGKELTEDKLAERMMDKLVEKGIVMLHLDDGGEDGNGQKSIEGKDGKKKVKENKNPVDAENIPEVGEKSESVSQDQKNAEIGKELKEQQNSSKPGQDRASDKNFPDLGTDDEPGKMGGDIPKGGEDLSSLEHSENMGTEGEKQSWEDA